MKLIKILTAILLLFCVQISFSQEEGKAEEAKKKG